MEAIFDILTNLKAEDDVRDLWQEIFHFTDDNKYTAHNLILGFPQKGDTILWQQMVNKQPNTMGWAKQTVSYPPENSTHMARGVITGIAVIDVKNDKNGGSALIKSGGVGAESVAIKLTADFWRGLSFQVIIIGKYLKNNNQLTNDLNKDNKDSNDNKYSFNINLNK